MDHKHIPNNCTLAQYRVQYASAGLCAQLEKWIKVSYIAFALGVVMMMLNPMQPVVGAGLLVAAKIGVGQKRIPGCALAMALVGAVMTTLMMLSGLLWIVCGVAMLGVFKKIDAEYRELMANLSI